MGGTRGYYAANWLWSVRGIMDRITGGPGLRRGRRSAGDLRVGDAVDFWRVTRLQPGHLLELTAEMNLPGVATLTFEVSSAHAAGVKVSRAPSDDAATTLVMTARFRPHGLLGILYWYAVLPLHGIVFRGMLKGIVRAAADGASLHSVPSSSHSGPNANA